MFWWLAWYLALGSLFGIFFSFLVDKLFTGNSNRIEFKGGKYIKFSIDLYEETSNSIDQGLKIQYELLRSYVMPTVALIATIFWVPIFLGILVGLAKRFESFKFGKVEDKE